MSKNNFQVVHQISGRDGGLPSQQLQRDFEELQHLQKARRLGESVSSELRMGPIS